MSLILADRVRETTQTTGTGTITLDGAVQGFQSFSVIGNNNTTYYTINRGSEWEVGLGTYYGGTLSRDTVYASSNSGSKVNFSAGSKDVFVTYPASKSVNEDANNRVLIPYTTGTTNVGSLNVGDATAHTDSGVIAGFTASEPLYLYTSLQNTSTANTSYASYAVNDGGHTAYGELGINNSNYSYSAAGFPNNGFSTPLATFVESYGGPLVLGSWDNQKISMIINGAVSTTDAMTINTNGSVAFNGQVGTAGQLLQSNATSAPTWVTPNAGTVTSVSGTGTVSGISLSGTVTSSGNLTLGGTLDLSSPPAIGGTSPAAVTATTLIGGGGSANYGQLTGGATTKAVQFQTLGSDGNVSLAIQPKGTGAIDLATGSSGVNISNGGTVTAITRTAGGTGYTVAPTITISAPTTAGGVQATATCTVTAGVVDSTFTITNAGSGYVEQPTITFTPVSGGSGATAYATVGSTPVIRSLGQNLDFYTPNNTSTPSFRVLDNQSAGTGQFISVRSSSTIPLLLSSASLNISSTSTNNVSIFTNANSQEQMRVSHTASAVNYVQVTGGATGGGPAISTQGSDGNAGLAIRGKGSGFVTIGQDTTTQFGVSRTVSAVNYILATGGIAGSAPSFTSTGTDADIDLTFTPKGAGAVRFGTHTGTILTPTGYITIKDSGGTTRRLLVG